MGAWQGISSFVYDRFSAKCAFGASPPGSAAIGHAALGSMNNALIFLLGTESCRRGIRHPLRVRIGDA